MVVEGKGSFGIVFSSPRIPLDNENYDDIKNLNQVSKILYSVEDNNYLPASLEEIKLAYQNLILLIKSYPQVFNSDSFILPITGGYIDKLKFIEYYKNTKLDYGFNWLSSSNTNLNILNQLLTHKDKIYQIVYEKGIPINFCFDDFIIKINNILQTLIYCKANRFYFDDIKYSNLIVHNEKIKIIDWEEPINLNLEPDKYIETICDSKLNCVMYFTYDIVSNILLFEYIGKIKKIYNLPNVNYYKLILVNSYMYEVNVVYKIRMFYDFTKIWKKYLPNFTLDLEVIYLLNNLDNIYNIKSKKNIQINSKIFDETIKILYEDYFTTNYSYCKYNYSIEKYAIINQIFNLNKKFIELTTNNLEDKISYFLTNTNIHSFGFVFLDWLKNNISIIVKSKNLEQILKKIIKIIIFCCLNFVFIDENIFLIEKNYLVIEKILNE